MSRIVAVAWGILLASGAAAQPAAESPAAEGRPASPPASRPWFNAGWPGFAQPLKDPQKLPRIRVEGNRFVDAQGKPLLLRGASISDPDKIERQGHWNKAHFEQVKALGGEVVRIPVHPAAWRERTPEKYLKLLDQAVDWCTELELYVIIDWHTIGNLEMELFQNPMYDTTKKETYEFWRAIARRYARCHTVAFFEFFNEPTTFRGQLGSVQWSQWRRTNENLIRLVRAWDAQAIPVVAGFDWAYDLTPLLEDPIAAEGIAYAVHPYEHKRQQPWPPKWEEDFGFAAAKYPLIATEFGFGGRRRLGPQEQEKIGPEHYGNQIVDYLEGKGISWVTWCFDPEWGPPLLVNWDYELTASGEFFKSRMSGKVAK